MNTTNAKPELTGEALTKAMARANETVQVKAELALLLSLTFRQGVALLNGSK